MILLAMVMAVWTSDLKAHCGSSVGFGAFVDDRILWSDNCSALSKALEVTQQFDTDVCFNWNKGKGAIAAHHLDGEFLASWESCVGKWDSSITYVGVYFNFARNATNAFLRKKGENGLNVLLQRISTVGTTASARCNVIGRFVATRLHYGVAWHAWNDRKSARFAVRIGRCIYPKQYIGRSPTLFWALTLKPQLHPSFIRDFGVVQTQMRRQRQLAYDNSGGISAANGSATMGRSTLRNRVLGGEHHAEWASMDRLQQNWQ